MKHSHTTLDQYYRRCRNITNRGSEPAGTRAAVALMFLLTMTHKAASSLRGLPNLEQHLDSIHQEFRANPDKYLTMNWSLNGHFIRGELTILSPKDYWESMKHTVPDEIRDYIDTTLNLKGLSIQFSQVIR